MVKLIKTLITAAVVAGFDETTLRAGPAGTKKYVLGAFTERYSALFLGQRTLASFRDFGISPSSSASWYRTGTRTTSMTAGSASPGSRHAAPSERGVRPLKTQQKISGRLTSSHVTQARLDIRSYIDTARKHGQDVLTALRAAMTGTPMEPPSPGHRGRPRA